MGVRGLARLVAAKCTPRRVELGSEHRLLVDGPALTYYLFRELDVPWRAGGDLARFAHGVREFVRKLCGCGVRVEAFFDCAEKVDPAKLQCTLKRRAADVRAAKKAVKALDKGQTPAGFVLPLLAFDVVRAVFAGLGVPVTDADPRADASLGCEADPYMAAAAARDPAAIVLTNDSDLLIFDDVPAVAFLGFLEVVDDSLTVLRVFQRSQVATALGVSEDDLARLACLVGNDHSDQDSLARWHAKLRINTFALNSQQVVLAAITELREDRANKLNAALGASWSHESLRAARWYRAEPHKAAPDEEAAACYWWPRPVIEDFGSDLYIADILRPLRAALFDERTRTERGPPQFAPPRPCAVPANDELASALRACVARIRADADADAVVEIAQLCLGAAKLALLSEPELERVRGLWRNAPTQSAARAGQFEASAVSPRAVSVANLLQGVLHTIFAQSSAPPLLAASQPLGATGRQHGVPLGLLFDASLLGVL